MPKNHPVHDRAHPALSEGREPMDTKRHEGSHGKEGLRYAKDGATTGGINSEHEADALQSELRSKQSHRNTGKEQHFDRHGEHFSEPEGPAGAANMTKSHHDGSTAKAEHHTSAGEPHRFEHPMSRASHGYGHSKSNRDGALRMSGHSGAHRIGKR